MDSFNESQALSADKPMIAYKIGSSELAQPVRPLQAHERNRRSGLPPLRRRREERPAELDRLKDNLVNAVSHELRTPLSSILGYAEFLEDDVAGSLTTPQREFVTQIQLGAKRLQNLVEEILDFARMDAGTFRLNEMEFDFNDRLKITAAAMAPEALESDLTLECQTSPGPLLMNADIQRIDQVLVNLLHNAIKFTPPGGTIRARAEKQGDRLLCEIKDTGIGIAPSHLPKLFERFSQLAPGVRTVTGSGLGLSISEQIIKAHTGTIGVLSTLGHGSTFWFTLPLVEPCAAS